MMSSRENRGFDRGNGFDVGLNRLAVDSSDSSDDEDEDFLSETSRDRTVEFAIVMRIEVGAVLPGSASQIWGGFSDFLSFLMFEYLAKLKFADTRVL